MKVFDVMTEEVVTATPDESLKQAAAKMVQARISGLPVLDDSAKLVGIITEADFLRYEASRGERNRKGLLHALFEPHEPIEEPVTVGEAMTRDPVVVLPEASLSEAARLMASKGVKRLPVVDPNGKLLGIVSRADVVAAFTRPDEVIEDEIREDVVKRILFLDPDAIEVDVSDGIVTLSGEIENQSDVRLLEELVRRLDGVVRVDGQLTWRVAEKSRPGYGI